MALLRRFLVLLSVLAALQAPSLAVEPNGSLQVMVTDDTGAYVPNAHIYLLGGDDKRITDAPNMAGTTSFQLPPGDYRVYSAIAREGGDYTDHYASPEAHVIVVADDMSSVILHLTKAPAGVFYLSENARKKIGLDPDLARYLN